MSEVAEQTKQPEKKEDVELDLRQVRFIKNYKETGKVYQSAVDAGYSKSYARVLSARLKSGVSPNVSKTIKQTFDDVGLTDEFLTEALHEDIKGKPKRRTAELQLAFKVKGLLDERPADGATNNIVVQILQAYNIKDKDGKLVIDADPQT